VQQSSKNQESTSKSKNDELKVSQDNS